MKATARIAIVSLTCMVNNACSKPGDAALSVTKTIETKTEMSYGAYLGDGQFQQNEHLIEQPVIEIQSKVDSIVTNDMRLNRGNCVAYPELPITLQFGEITKLYPGCDVIELELRTSKGEFSYMLGR